MKIPYTLPSSKTAVIEIAASQNLDGTMSERITIRVTGLEDTPPDQTRKIDDGWSNQLPEGVNFILTAARGNQEGAYWRNTYEWTGCSRTSAIAHLAELESISDSTRRMAY